MTHKKKKFKKFHHDGAKKRFKTFHRDGTKNFCNVNTGLKSSTVIVLKKQFYLLPSRQIVVPRTSRGRPPPKSPGRPLKIVFDRPRDVPIWRPGNVLKWRPGDVRIWRSKDVLGRLIQDVPRTFSGRSLEDLQSTQTWMSQHFFKIFLSELVRLTKSI